jgi:hypothetical protein
MKKILFFLIIICLGINKSFASDFDISCISQGYIEAPGTKEIKKINVMDIIIFLYNEKGKLRAVNLLKSTNFGGRYYSYSYDDPDLPSNWTSVANAELINNVVTLKLNEPQERRDRIYETSLMEINLENNEFEAKANATVPANEITKITAPTSLYLSIEGKCNISPDKREKIISSFYKSAKANKNLEKKENNSSQSILKKILK